MQFHETNHNNNQGMSRSLFKEHGEKLIYTTRNFEFKNAKPLVMEYFLKQHYDISEILKFRIPNTCYTVTGKEVNRNYSIANLNDMDLNTTWVTLQENPKITITFNEPTPFYGIFILGAYYKNENTYIENNRIKAISLNLEGLQSISTDNGEKYEKFQETHSIWMDGDFDYEPLYFDGLPGKCLSYMRERYNYKINVKKIEIIITEVFPGSKYKDTCISEIILLKDPYP